MKYKVYIQGMHCESCNIYISKILSEISDIGDFHINNKEQSVTIESSFPKNKLLNTVNKKLKDSGYYITGEPIQKQNNLLNHLIGIGIGAIILLLYMLLQNTQIISDINVTDGNYTLPFLLGIIASISSCMAVVGVFFLAISSQRDSKRDLFYLHISRVISFFLLGMLLGAVGTLFQFSRDLRTTFYLVTIIAMIYIALRQIGVLNNIQIFKTNIFKNIPSKKVSVWILGFLTFFLPCGFTQTTQILAMEIANPLQSGITMLLFSLGTLPVLALISFGFRGLRDIVNQSILQTSSGYTILFFSIYNLITMLISIGIIKYV